MPQRRAAELLKAIKQHESTQLKLQAMNSPHQFVQIAAKHGYELTPDDLDIQINQFSDSELASMMNPGIGKRQHLIPR